MKSILLFLLIILWMLLTVCLAISIIGNLVFVFDDGEGGWFTTGKELMKDFRSS